MMLVKSFIALLSLAFALHARDYRKVILSPSLPFSDDHVHDGSLPTALQIPRERRSAPSCCGIFWRLHDHQQQALVLRSNLVDGAFSQWSDRQTLAFHLLRVLLHEGGWCETKSLLSLAERRRLEWIRSLASLHTELLRRKGRTTIPFSFLPNFFTNWWRAIYQNKLINNASPIDIF